LLMAALDPLDRIGLWPLPTPSFVHRLLLPRIMLLLLLPFFLSFLFVLSRKLPVYESRPLSNSHASHTENPALLTLFT
jgi:hypothetical protein